MSGSNTAGSLVYEYKSAGAKAGPLGSSVYMNRFMTSFWS